MFNIISWRSLRSLGFPALSKCSIWAHAHIYTSICTHRRTHTPTHPCIVHTYIHTSDTFYRVLLFRFVFFWFFSFFLSSFFACYIFHTSKPYRGVRVYLTVFKPNLLYFVILMVKPKPDRLQSSLFLTLLNAILLSLKNIFLFQSVNLCTWFDIYWLRVRWKRNEFF